MDGFASSIAAINVNSLKTTFQAQTPTVILGDTEILKNAPYRMIAAGLGDLLGKFTCLCDWKLSRLINREHYCENIAGLVESCVQNVLKDAGKAKDRDPEVLGKIMEGLVLTGVAMSLYGTPGRPPAASTICPITGRCGLSQPGSAASSPRDSGGRGHGAGIEAGGKAPRHEGGL